MHDNAAIGLLILDSNDVVVTDNEVYRSDDSDDTKYPGSAGIWLHGTTTVLTLEQNCIVDNVDYGLRNETGAVVTAEDNWWGNASGPYHSTNPTGSGNAVTDNVDFDPWLTTDPCGISPVESTTWGAIKAMYR
jgi:hypothetical protein